MAYLRWGSKAVTEISCSKGKIVFRNSCLEELADVSNWYIYWDCGSGDDRDSQLLAIWYEGDERLPLISYKKLKHVNTTKELKDLLKLHEVGLEPSETDYEVALRAINKWKKEVEEDYKP